MANKVPKIHVSEIANFVRMTRWGRNDIANTFENIWKRTDPLTYKSSSTRQTIREINDVVRQNTIPVASFTTMTSADVPKLREDYKKVVDHVEEEKKRELIDDLQQAYDLPEDEAISIKKALLDQSKIDTSDINPEEPIEKIQSKLKRARLEDREHIDDYYGGVSNKTLGTTEELSAAEMYSQRTGLCIEENNSQVFRKKYKTKKGRNFVVSGMVDGFCTPPNDEKMLIEIKNRTKRLFKSVPMYEYTQVLFYMAMTKTQKGELVERYENTIHINKFSFNEKAYKDALKSLSRHVDYLLDFLENEDIIKNYQQMSLQERNRYLNQNMSLL